MIEPVEINLKPHRSVLYMPGSNDRALEKAKTLPADALILDLEDAVAPDAKVDARAKVCAAAEAARAGEYGGKVVTIRVNGIGTQWHAADLVAAAAAGPDAIVVPKVNTAEEVKGLATALEWAGAPEHTTLWAMIETPQAIFNVRDIAAASDRLTALVMGTNDLIKELRGLITPGRPALVAALSQAVLAARAADKLIFDGVYNDVKDEAGFAEEAAQGRVLGFDGKTLIHPGQVEPANAAFAPSDADIEFARAVIDAFDAAQAQGKGVVTVNGRLIENLHVAEARRVLAYADAIAARA